MGGIHEFPQQVERPSNVRRWTDDLLPPVEADRDPLGVMHPVTTGVHWKRRQNSMRSSRRNKMAASRLYSGPALQSKGELSPSNHTEENACALS